jgi:hypothetical protein
VTRKTLSDLLNRHSGMSPEMALRLRKGRMEHGGRMASHADELEPLARPPAGQQNQGEEIPAAGADVT